MSTATRRWQHLLVAAAFMVGVAAIPLVIDVAPAFAGATDCYTGSGDVCLYKNSSYATGGIRHEDGNWPDYRPFSFDYCTLNCE